MKGYMYECAKCRRIEIVPASRMRFTDGLHCTNCGCNVVARGPVEYGIDLCEQQTAHKKTACECTNSLAESIDTNSKKKLEEFGQVELVAEGIAFDDGVLRLNKGDTLILKADRALTPDITGSIVDKCKQHGIDCIILHRWTEIVGIIEGNRLVEC